MHRYCITLVPPVPGLLAITIWVVCIQAAYPAWCQHYLSAYQLCSAYQVRTQADDAALMYYAFLISKVSAGDATCCAYMTTMTYPT